MEISELINYLFLPASQIALIMAIAQLFKNVGLDSRWIPIADVFLGLLSGVGIYGLYLNYGVVNGIVLGVAFGLSACGLFSGVKNLVERSEK